MSTLPGSETVPWVEPKSSGPLLVFRRGFLLEVRLVSDPSLSSLSARSCFEVVKELWGLWNISFSLP